MSGLHTELFNLYLRGRSLLEGNPRFYLMKDLDREQWLEPEQLDPLRLKRLQALIGQALKHSRYYQEKLRGIIADPREISDLSQLAKLPLLKRADIQDNYDGIFCPGRPGVYRDMTGGSTGVPVHFCHDGFYKSYSDACEMFYLTWLGLKRGDRTAILWGAERDFSDLSLRDTVNIKYMERIRYLNAFNVTEAILERFLEDLEKFDPEFIYGYASSLHMAARYILKTGRYTIRPRAIKSSAEMLYEHQRRDIQEAFEAPVYNFYGSREINNLAAECPSLDGLHVFASGRIIEIVDDAGQPLPPGQVGLLAITDLTNLSFPFIRYITGDMGSIKTGRCSCGRGYPLLENITGRQYDIVVLNGNNIYGHFFTSLIFKNPDVRQFQVVQEGPDKVTIKVVIPKRTLDTEYIHRHINEHVGANVDVNFEFVDDIPPLKSGKYRFIVNDMVKSLRD